jgi:hypothetical protein
MLLLENNLYLLLLSHQLECCWAMNYAAVKPVILLLMDHQPDSTDVRPTNFRRLVFEQLDY